MVPHQYIDIIIQYFYQAMESFLDQLSNSFHKEYFFQNLSFID